MTSDRRQDRPWSEYPAGTIAESIIGGYWTKTEPGGWKWCVGDTFPRPGADAYAVRLPRGSAESV